MITAYIAVGSNLGDRLGNLARAVDAVGHMPQTHVERVSHAYESAPGYKEDQPDFLNAVVEVSTGLESEALLGYLLDLETEMGRLREEPNGPRVIDLDLLLFGDEERVSEGLTLPHPGIAERDFVVTPLLELVPRMVLPDGRHLRRSEATVGTVVRDLGPVPDAGVAHNVPVEPVEWVAVAESTWAQEGAGGFDAGLQLKREVLATEGIPYAFEPYEPGIEVDPFGLPSTFKLLVPSEFAEKAAALLAEVDAAPPVFPEGMEPE